MSLAGYLPPLCDEEVLQEENVAEGIPRKTRAHYLVDGGYLNNVPVGQMAELLPHGGVTIAVDIGAVTELGGYNYGTHCTLTTYTHHIHPPHTLTVHTPTRRRALRLVSTAA
jgi:predicted acylesterase/phospholipase RssA